VDAILGFRKKWKWTVDVFFKILKKWKWKVDIFLKKTKKSVEVESGKPKKWIILANIFENVIFENLFVAAIAFLFEIFPNPCLFCNAGLFLTLRNALPQMDFCKFLRCFEAFWKVWKARRLREK